MPSLIYAVLGPALALLGVQLALKIEGEPDLFYQGAFPLTVGLFYLGGAIPALILARVLDALGLHRVRLGARVVLGLVILLCAGAVVAGAARHLEFYMTLIPPLMVCCLLVRALNRLFGR